MTCLQCGSTVSVKNGFMKGLQRYKCKVCGYQFTQETPRGKPFKYKILALTLYLSGLSMNMTAKIVGVTTQSVMRWIKQFCHQYAEMPMQEGIVEEIKIDDICHFIGKKSSFFRPGKYFVIHPEGCLGGNVVIVVRKH